MLGVKSPAMAIAMAPGAKKAEIIAIVLAYMIVVGFQSCLKVVWIGGLYFLTEVRAESQCSRSMVLSALCWR